jgi:hypothetical protein
MDAVERVLRRFASVEGVDLLASSLRSGDVAPNYAG